MAEKFEVNAVGRISREPELRYLPNGTALAEFGLATSKDYKKQGDTEWTKSTIFSNWQAWGNRVEQVTGLKKGQKVNLIGDYSVREWEDKATGEKRSRGEFKFNRFGDVEESVRPVETQPVNSITQTEDEDIPF